MKHQKTFESPLFTDLSHDLLTPLHGVLGNVKLLLDTQLNAAQREYAEMILTSGQDLLVELLAVLEQPTQPKTQTGSVPEVNYDFKGVRVLIAEDNEINQKVAEKTLIREGFLVTLAGNGREALQILKALPFDLVLMDCQMPEMDGYETTRRIRELPEHLRNIPIIAMTANVVKGDRERCLQAGMNDYISKPFELAQLLAAIAKVVKKKAV